MKAFILWLALSGTALSQSTNAAPPTPVIGHPASQWIGKEIEVVVQDKTVKGTVARVEPDGLSLITDDGGCFVPFDKLNESDQNKYGYDRDAENAYKASEAEAEAKAHAKAVARHKAMLEQERQDAANAAYQASQIEKYSSQQIILIKVLQILDDGVLGYLGGDDNGPVVFLHNVDGSGLHHDDLVKGSVISSGTYSYKNTYGETQNVAEFDSVPDAWVNPNLRDPYAAAPTHFSMDPAAHPDQ